MTEIPDHLLRRAQKARDTAAGLRDDLGDAIDPGVTSPEAQALGRRLDRPFDVDRVEALMDEGSALTDQAESIADRLEATDPEAAARLRESVRPLRETKAMFDDSLVDLRNADAKAEKHRMMRTRIADRIGVAVLVAGLYRLVCRIDPGLPRLRWRGLIPLAWILLGVAQYHRLTEDEIRKNWSTADEINEKLHERFGR